MLNKPPLMEHQQEYLDRFKNKYHAALFWSPGLGKTRAVIANFCHLYQEGKVNAMLIVTMKITLHQIAFDETAKYMDSDIDYKSAIYTTGLKADDKKRLKQMQMHKGAKILVVNHAQLITKNGRKIIEDFLKNNMVFFVMDESHKIKTPRAKVTRAAIALSKWADYKRILTGTAITNNILNLYSQFYFLDHRVIGFRRFTAFKSYYCIMEKRRAAGGHFYEEITGYRNVKELKAHIAPYVIEKKLDECVDLPGKTYETVYIKLTPKQQEIYEELINDSIALVKEPPEDLTTKEEILAWAIANDAFIKAENKLTELLRLQQLMSGLEDGSVPTNRYDALKELLEMLEGEQVVIWAHFRYEIERIKEMLGDDAVIYYGSMSNKDRLDAVEKFKTGEAKYFVANPAAAGVGIDALKVARYAIYFNNSYNLEHRLQSENRIYRIGQDKKVVIYDIVTKGKIDAVVLKKLKEKSNISDEFFRGE